MLAQLFPLAAACLLVYVFMWLSVLAADEGLDAHEAGLAVVAARNPFREQGPPANMAKLILLRHKIQTTNRKRRSSSQSRQPTRACNQSLIRQSPWAPFPQGLRRETVPLINSSRFLYRHRHLDFFVLDIAIIYGL
ncbi:hypothetical protein MVEN_01274600 [Mycena venus]|uniref:Secreted protein n=1 Tax=Mycena venus TaxID=2733690 RepID=A0A8H7CYQ5_9AGAR|nr:hypothetical protein MVEN_01274600 [Mycena venus]